MTQHYYDKSATPTSHKRPFEKITLSDQVSCVELDNHSDEQALLSRMYLVVGLVVAVVG